MRKLLTLTCCFGLALLASAAQNNNQNNNQQNKKRGGNAQQQQQVVTGPTKLHGTQHYNPNAQQSLTGQQHYKGQKFSGQKFSGQTTTNTKLNTTKFSKQQKFGAQNQTNVSGNAASTKFNKGKLGQAQGMKFQKQHFNLQTNKVVNKYKTVTFSKNYKIKGFFGSNPINWGPKYSVFVNYSPVWQPTWWWNWHYGSHIVFIYGGWYYWNANYWYPAWGYAPDSVYYFDGPIYASSPADDPAQVVANVQSALKEEGYYQGDIDGILGPQTRAALAEYQSAQGLEPTGLVDEPTLESLNMA
jgi:Putative peptidoglycan binding domain